MKKFKIEMMDNDNYTAMRSGSYDYHVNYIDIEAETSESALAIAKSLHPDWIANETYVKSLEELEAEKAKREAERKAEKAKEAEKKAKRELAKQKKIEADLANGITPEMRKAMNAIKRYDKKIEELEAELAKLKAKRAEAEKRAKG